MISSTTPNTAQTTRTAMISGERPVASGCTMPTGPEGGGREGGMEGEGRNQGRREEGGKEEGRREQGT